MVNCYFRYAEGVGTDNFVAQDENLLESTPLTDLCRAEYLDTNSFLFSYVCGADMRHK